MADEKLSAQEAYGEIMGIKAGDRPIEGGIDGAKADDYNRGWDAGVAELHAAMTRDGVNSPEQALEAVLAIRSADQDTDEHTDDYNDGWTQAVSLGQEYATSGLHPEPGWRAPLLALYEERRAQLDADEVPPGEESEAFKSAERILGVKPRGGSDPAFITEHGNYFVVAVFMRNARNDEAQRRTHGRSPCDQLAAELREACKVDGLALMDFGLSEPNPECAERIDPSDLARAADQCAAGPVASRVVRKLIRALSSRSSEIVQEAKESAQRFLSAVRGN